MVWYRTKGLPFGTPVEQHYYIDYRKTTIRDTIVALCGHEEKADLLYGAKWKKHNCPECEKLLKEKLESLPTPETSRAGWYDVEGWPQAHVFLHKAHGLPVTAATAETLCKLFSTWDKLSKNTRKNRRCGNCAKIANQGGRNKVWKRRKDGH